MTWNEKSGKIKPLRGKRIILRTSPDASYEELREKAVKRYKDFYRNILQSEELNYSLTFENGDKATYIPGSSEPFTLRKYKEEVGKEYKSITFYLLSSSDEIVLETLHVNPFDDNDFEDFLLNNDGALNFDAIEPLVLSEVNTDTVSNPSKRLKHEQEMIDEVIAKELQEKLMEELQSEITSLPELISQLQGNIIKNKQFFIVCRRGSSLERRLALWKRESNKTNPHNQLMVHYSGESGIDDGAMHKEFLTDIMVDIRKTLFTNGGPRDSMLDIQNGNFYACGQISSASIVQGGPPPLLLYSNMFNLMLEGKMVDLRNLDINNHFIPSDKELLQRIRDDPLKESDVIIENGYTGTINKGNIECIIGTVMIGITSRRINYLSEFLRGLETFGVKNYLFSHKHLLEPVFTISNDFVVNANYVFSLLKPSFSLAASSKRIVEERVLDYIQDFLIMLEDTSVTGPSEALAYHSEDLTSSDEEKESYANLSPSGIMKWLTGQSHKPMSQEDMDITVKFNHDCMTANPDHTICFPLIHACSRQLSLPVMHMKTFDEFKDNFKLAFCKGQAFGME